MGPLPYYDGPAPLFKKRPDQKYITLRSKKCQAAASSPSRPNQMISASF